MGKARIVSGGEDGRYWVELLHNRDRIDAELADLTQRLTDLQAELDALEAEREPLVAERNWIATDIDEAVASAEDGDVPDVEALLVELAQVSAKIQALDARIAMLKGRILVARKRQQMLQAVPENPTQEAWCADLTEDLAGEVATVEVPAEGIVGQFLTWRRMQIRPGFFDRAAYLKPRDGQMFHRQGMSPEQAYFSAAILPGVQRWRPQYRIGTLVSVDQGNDTCSLNLQSEDSSAQGLIIDPPVINTLTLSGVPIEYMDCNAMPFEVGDRVLVEFQDRDWAQPRVIGFEKEPKGCFPRYVTLRSYCDVITFAGPEDGLPRLGLTWKTTSFRCSGSVWTTPFDPPRLVLCWYDLALAWDDLTGPSAGMDLNRGARLWAQEIDSGAEMDRSEFIRPDIFSTNSNYSTPHYLLRAARCDSDPPPWETSCPITQDFCYSSHAFGDGQIYIPYPFSNAKNDPIADLAGSGGYKAFVKLTGEGVRPAGFLCADGPFEYAVASEDAQHIESIADVPQNFELSRSQGGAAIKYIYKRAEWQKIENDATFADFWAVRLVYEREDLA